MTSTFVKLGGRIAEFTLTGIVFGSLGAVLFAFWFPGVYWVVGGHSTQILSFALDLLLIGALVGGLTGLCLGLAREAETGERDVSVPHDSESVMPVGATGVAGRIRVVRRRRLPHHLSLPR
jgi:hypothetical protein